MKKVKWQAGLLYGLLAATMVATSACGGGGEKKATPSTPAETGTSKKTIEITFWHSMGGDLGKALEQLVADYNSSQTKIHVTSNYQGSYPDSLTKLKVSFDSKSGPSLIQVYDVGTRYMFDTKAVTPIQNFIDSEKFELSQFEAKTLSYYKINDKLYSMPFNTSVPVLFYNKDLFKAAGLDSEKPPRTLDEIKAAALKLSKNNVTGISIPTDPWYMEQFYAAQGAEYVNNGNGRTSAPTESYVNKETGVNTLTWWKDLIDAKAASNLGKDGAQTIQAFQSGQTAMMLMSSGALRGVVNSTQGKFEVGLGLFPTTDSAKDKFGVVTGGASLWVLGNKSEEEQRAAWDFTKYLSSPKVQASWTASSGYLPMTKLAYNEQQLKDIISKYPQFNIAVDELHQSQISVATQGAAMGPFTEQRTAVQTAIEEALYGKKAPKDALDGAVKGSAEMLAKYNAANK